MVIVKEPVPPKVEVLKVVKKKQKEKENENPLAEEEELATIAQVEEDQDQDQEQGKNRKLGWRHKEKTGKRKHKSEIEELEVDEMPVPIIGTKIDKLIEDTAQQEQAAGGTPEIVPGIETEPVITLEDRVRNERLAAIEKIAREKPEEVAVLLKAWLSDEQN
jgi:hypothetical protein